MIEREPLDTLAFECLVYCENDRLLIVAIFIARSGTDFDDASNDYLIGVGDDVVKARPSWVSLREQRDRRDKYENCDEDFLHRRSHRHFRPFSALIGRNASTSSHSILNPIMEH